MGAESLFELACPMTWRILLLFKVSSESAPSSGHQVEDQDRRSNHEQQVNQTTADVEAEAQYPQNQHNHENRPKNTRSLVFVVGAQELEPWAPAMH